MRLLLTAAAGFLMTAHAHAEIVRVEFEGQLTRVDEGFPVPLAEDETIRGNYLTDTGSYLQSNSDVLGEIIVQPIRGFSLAGSSGWARYGFGQIDFFGADLIPSAVNQLLFGRPSASAYVSLLGDEPIDFTDQSGLGRIISSQIPDATFVTFQEYFDLSQNPRDPTEAINDRFFITPLFVEPNLGFDLIAGSRRNTLLNRNGDVRFGFTTISRPSDQLLDPPLIDSLAIRLPIEGQGNSSEIAVASFSIDRVTVVPEPATFSLAALFAVFAFRRHR